MSYLEDYFANSAAEQKEGTKFPTLGIVVDTNDPQQRGRVRVMCPKLGDDPDPATMDVDHLPWALTTVPFGGFIDQGFRGNGTSIGDETSYGMFGTPKIGAQALVDVIDGNNSLRVVTGYIYDTGGANTLPHGRYQVKGGAIEGPLAVGGSPIEPLYSNGKAAFANPFFNVGDSHASFEWMSRGADKTVAAHREFDKRPNQSDSDDEGKLLVELDGRITSQTQGYAPNRMGSTPEMSGARDAKYDPQTYCWVTPGFHAISMDDRKGNTRIRLRTTTGHQILLDDTNERIYIGTNQGNAWLEMDSCGNIDVHSETRVSIHAAKDINMTAGESIRLTAKELHLKSSQETRMTAGTDLGIHSNTNIRVGALMSTYLQSGIETHMLVGTTLYVTSGSNMNLNSGGNVLTTSTGTNETLAGGNIIESAPTIYMNSGAQAQPADGAQMAAEQPARHTNRVPQHEPWPRMMIDPIRANMTVEEGKSPDSLEKWASPPILFSGLNPADFELKSYSSPLIGRMENGVVYVRNKHWHR